MVYYAKKSDDAAAMNAFLRKPERLAAFMRACSWDVNHRIERYASVLKELESIDDTSFGNSIELTNNEIDKFLTTLDSDMYTMVPNKRNT